MKASSIAVLLLALPTPLLNVAASLAQEQLPADDRACMIAAIGKLPKLGALKVDYQWWSSRSACGDSRNRDLMRWRQRAVFAINPRLHSRSTIAEGGRRFLKNAKCLKNPGLQPGAR